MTVNEESFYMGNEGRITLRNGSDQSAVPAGDFYGIEITCLPDLFRRAGDADDRHEYADGGPFVVHV